MPPEKRKAKDAAVTDSADAPRIIKSKRANGRSVQATSAADRPRRTGTSASAASEPKDLKNSAPPTSAKSTVKKPAAKATATSSTDAPKKRGRPPKSSAPAAATKAKPDAHEGIKKRGRPPKGTTSSTAAKVQKNVPTEGMRSSLRLQSSAAPRTSKVAFAKTTATIPAKASGSGKPRGRPPKKSILKNGDTADIATADPEAEAVETKPEKSSKAATAPKGKSKAAEAEELNGEDENEEGSGDGPSLWVMKAEPESRMEKGVDVKFSIDDLAAAQEPQGWDGVRNPAAKNNMMAMKEGDLAFFYHSNCKVPGIAGVMEIVQEHSVDESAFDENHPYFDPKSNRDNPKWHLVHVEFRRKFPRVITLTELKSFAKPGGALENLLTLKQSRLSVSKISSAEWDFIMSLLEDDTKSPEAPNENSTQATNGEPQLQLEAELKDQIAEEEGELADVDEALEDEELDEGEDAADENVGEHASE